MNKLTSNKDATKALEAKYESLKFSGLNFGSFPMQETGWYNGMRFYFRFRHNQATLRVGPHDEEVEFLYTLRVNQDKARRVKNWIKEHGDDKVEDLPEIVKAFGRPFSEAKARMQKETDLSYMPHRIAAKSSYNGDYENDPHKGELTPNELFDVFSELIDNLEEIPYEEQLTTSTKIWLYKGRTAKEDYEQELLELKQSQ